MQGEGLGLRVGAIHVDVLGKKLVKVVPKGALAPLFGELTDIERHDDHHHQ